MRAIVTGGAGFIGSHLVDRLVKEGHEVTVIDNLSTGKRENVNPSTHFLEKSILDPDIGQAIKDKGPDAIFHLAAQIDVRRSVEDPIDDASTNILGTINLLEGMKHAGAKKIIFSSTGGAIYGEQDTFPAPENHPEKPVSPYGIAKLSIEHYLFYYNWVPLRWSLLASLDQRYL